MGYGRYASISFSPMAGTELTAFFQELATLVGRSGAGCQLYLNATRLWDANPGQRDFFHPEAILRNPTEYLLAYGIDAFGLRGIPHLVLMEGQHRLSRSAVKADDWIRQVAQQSGLASADKQRRGASLITRQPNAIQLGQFDKFAKALETSRVPDVVYALDMHTESESRQDLIAQLAEEDKRFVATGAWLPMTSQASALRTVQRTLLELPDCPMIDTPLKGQGTNLRVRVGQQGSRTYLQIVNNAPWAEDIACVVQQSAENPRVSILGGHELKLHMARSQDSDASGYRSWRFTVPAYDLIGIAVDDPGFRLVEVVHAPPKEVLDRVSEELTDLESIIAQATDPTLQLRLANVLGDFEQWSTGGQPVGWNISSLPDVKILRSNELPHSGESSLMIENQNTGEVSAWIQSVPLTRPKTGRLAFQAWIRSPTVGGSGRVRLSVMGRAQSGDKFEKALELAVGADSRSISHDWGTQPATLYVANIPLDVPELSVAIELIGQGRIWIDDVEVLQSWLHPDETFYLQGTMFVAKQKLTENNLYPAEKLLNSHWGHYLSEFQPLDVNASVFAR